MDRTLVPAIANFDHRKVKPSLQARGIKNNLAAWIAMYLQFQVPDDINRVRRNRREVSIADIDPSDDRYESSVNRIEFEQAVNHFDDEKRKEVLADLMNQFKTTVDKFLRHQKQASRWDSWKIRRARTLIFRRWLAALNGEAPLEYQMIGEQEDPPVSKQAVKSFEVKTLKPELFEYFRQKGLPLLTNIRDALNIRLKTEEPED